LDAAAAGVELDEPELDVEPEVEPEVELELAPELELSVELDFSDEELLELLEEPLEELLLGSRLSVR
jgi:hypothetical protein